MYLGPVSGATYYFGMRCKQSLMMGVDDLCCHEMIVC
jgi:hypothetical protein